ncbi:MAG TPA: hypothetical protein VGB20_02460 [bacterium]
MAVLAVVDDLLCRERITAAATAAGVPVTVCLGPPPGGTTWELVLVDLNLASGDALEAVRVLRARDPSMPIIGWCAHVQDALRRDAAGAGCTEVLPRSAFAGRLGELLRGVKA